jgi:hypothetical protein
MTSCTDRDSARWNMDPITVQKRRNLFWEVFSADVSHVSPTFDPDLSKQGNADTSGVESGFGTTTCSPSLICRL